MLEMLPSAFDIGGKLINGLFGKKAQPATQSQKSGFYALPPQVQQAYLQQFLPGAQQWFNNGPNQYQQNAMQSLGGGPESLEQELPQYQNQYRGAVTDEVVKQMQRDAQGERDRIMMGAGSNGLGGLFSSALTKQLDGLNDNTLNRIGAYRAYSEDQGYNQSLDLRRQTLADMLAAGNMPYERINQFGSLLGQFPQSQNGQQIGAYQPKNWANKLGGTMMTLTKPANDFNQSRQPLQYGPQQQ